MDGELLKTIKERMKKATNGPWKVYRDEFSVRIGTEYVHNQLKAPSPIITEAHHVGGKVGIYINPDNAEFIAHSREDVELLLLMVEEMQNAIMFAESHIYKLEVFKQHAEFLLPNFQYNQIELEAARYLALEELEN